MPRDEHSGGRLPGVSRERVPQDPSIVDFMSTLQEIAAAALRLPEKDRLKLADKILGSLPAPVARVEPGGRLAEAIRRDAERENGRSRLETEEAFWAGAHRRST